MTGSGNTLAVKVPDGPSDDRFGYLSDVLPTAWQAVNYAGVGRIGGAGVRRRRTPTSRPSATGP